MILSDNCGEGDAKVSDRSVAMLRGALCSMRPVSLLGCLVVGSPSGFLEGKADRLQGRSCNDVVRAARRLLGMGQLNEMSEV